MVLPDVPATIFEGEAEMALVIGKRASHVKAADAMNYVFGYTNFIDGSARGLPPHSFFAMKSRDTFAPIGPYLVTADEIADPHKVPIKLWVNGDDQAGLQHRRHGAQHPALHRVGDVDPHAGTRRHPGHRHQPSRPQRFMDGDTVELECAGLGKLSFKVRDDLKRTWSRETRLDRQRQGLRHADAADQRKIRAGEVGKARSRKRKGGARQILPPAAAAEGTRRARCGYVAFRFQPNQSHTPWPITSSRSLPFSHGNSSVNIVTHCR